MKQILIKFGKRVCKNFKSFLKIIRLLKIV